jgi:hypothetical protein
MSDEKRMKKTAQAAQAAQVGPGLVEGPHQLGNWMGTFKDISGMIGGVSSKLPEALEKGTQYGEYERAIDVGTSAAGLNDEVYRAMIKLLVQKGGATTPEAIEVVSKVAQMRLDWGNPNVVAAIMGSMDRSIDHGGPAEMARVMNGIVQFYNTNREKPGAMMQMVQVLNDTLAGNVDQEQTEYLDMRERPVDPQYIIRAPSGQIVNRITGEPLKAIQSRGLKDTMPSRMATMSNTLMGMEKDPWKLIASPELMQANDSMTGFKGVLDSLVERPDMSQKTTALKAREMKSYQQYKFRQWLKLNQDLAPGILMALEKGRVTLDWMYNVLDNPAIMAAISAGAETASWPHYNVIQPLGGSVGNVVSSGSSAAPFLTGAGKGGVSAITPGIGVPKTSSSSKFTKIAKINKKSKFIKISQISGPSGFMGPVGGPTVVGGQPRFYPTAPMNTPMEQQGFIGPGADLAAWQKDHMQQMIESDTNAAARLEALNLVFDKERTMRIYEIEQEAKNIQKDLDEFAKGLEGADPRNLGVTDVRVIDSVNSKISEIAGKYDEILGICEVGLKILVQRRQTAIQADGGGFRNTNIKTFDQGIQTILVAIQEFQYDRDRNLMRSLTIKDQLMQQFQKATVTDTLEKQSDLLERNFGSTMGRLPLGASQAQEAHFLMQAADKLQGANPQQTAAMQARLRQQALDRASAALSQIERSAKPQLQGEAQEALGV